MKIRILILFLIFSIYAFADVKSIGTITSIDKGSNVYIGSPFNANGWAGTFNGSVDGSPAKFYCIDLGHWLVYNTPYQDIKRTNKYLSYILNKYYPYVPLPYSGALTETKEAAAIQMALWHYSDSLDINSCTPLDIANRAKQIVADANINAPFINLIKTLVLYIPNQSFVSGSPISFRAEVYDSLNRPVPNITVNFTTSAGTLSATSGVTDNSGVTPFFTLTPNAGQMSANLKANANVMILQGTEYYTVTNPNSNQKLVIATPVIANKNDAKDILWFNAADYGINKVSNKIKINNGDEVTYSIKIANKSSLPATNVSVLDILPPELNYVSSSGPGTYNPATGIWNFSTLAPYDTAVLQMNVIANITSPTTFNLGDASDYNVFVFHDMTATGSDIGGKLAVGNDLYLNSYAVGNQLTAGAGNVLIAGRKLTFITGRVYNGSVVYGQFIDTTHANLADDGITQGTPVDFVAAENYLLNLSAQLSAFVPNGIVVNEYNQLDLNGTNSNINIFIVDGALLKNITDFRINVPAGSTVLINISGDTLEWHNGYSINGTSTDKVFLNFHEAKSILLSYIGLKGILLAPKADVYFPSGHIDGQVIVKNLSGQGQIDMHLFTGTLQNQISLNNVAQVLNVNQNLTMDNLVTICSVTPVFTTGTEKEKSNIPYIFNLSQNYPNPFNPVTKIKYSIPSGTKSSTENHVTLKVYNILGNEVATLFSGYLMPGEYTADFDASALSSGTYFYELKYGNSRAMKKMILLK